MAILLFLKKSNYFCNLFIFNNCLNYLNMRIKTKNKIIENWRFLLGLPKSIIINFRYLAFNDAIKLPILLSHKTKLKNLRGKIKVEKVKFGIIKIGLGGFQSVDYKYERTIIDNQGEIIFKGKCKIASGTKISAVGQIVFGDDSNFGGNITIICHKKISFGSNTWVSWDNLIMDTDQHPIYNLQNEIINHDKEIFFGNNVWIGCRCTTMKGSYIGDNIIVGSNSNITGKHTKEFTVLAGNPLRIVKEGVKRDK